MCNTTEKLISFKCVQYNLSEEWAETLINRKSLRQINNTLVYLKLMGILMTRSFESSSII